MSFRSAAQWTLRPYLAQGPAAAMSSQGWLSDPSLPLHNTTIVTLRYQNSALHAARGPLEDIFGFKMMYNLHQGELMGGHVFSSVHYKKCCP